MEVNRGRNPKSRCVLGDGVADRIPVNGTLALASMEPCCT